MVTLYVKRNEEERTGDLRSGGGGGYSSAPKDARYRDCVQSPRPSRKQSNPDAMLVGPNMTATTNLLTEWIGDGFDPHADQAEWLTAEVDALAKKWSRSLPVSRRTAKDCIRYRIIDRQMAAASIKWENLDAGVSGTLICSIGGAAGDATARRPASTPVLV